MSPKRLAHVFDVQESTAARWRRLCPNWDPPPEVHINTVTTTSSADGVVPARGSRRPAPYPPASANQYTSRSDAPVVRHVRRGTTVAAVAALAAYGSIALVEALLQDRYAKSASSAMATLAATWHYFHEQAFSHEVPMIPYLPITVSILVMVATQQYTR